MYQKLLAKNLLCTGCGACINKCVSNAIEYIYDTSNDGSLVAKIISDKCTSCHQCEKVCPLMTEHENKNNIVQDCYAVWANDHIRMLSSSGGIFSVLAEEFLNQNGYVCGVAYGEHFKPEHIIISEKNDLHKLRRSKYVQSDIGFVFQKIQKLLEENQSVMFVGTPCQVAGLKSFLGRKYPHLLLVDIYCNFTPSYPLFKRYLDENYDTENIKEIDFRVKKYGWIADIHTVTYKDDTVVEKRTYNDSFQRGYHPKLFMRETCEQCRFAGNPRQGDISIADFWYIKDFYPELDDTKGTSCVVINNEIGQRFFEKIQDKLQLCRKVSIDCMRYNRGATTQAHPSRDRFYNLLNHMSFNESVDYALNGKYDVAIWGNWSEKNYGSELTYYALYEIIRSFGLDPLMVERPRNAVWAPNEAPVLFHETPYPADAIHTLYPDKVSMYELNQKSDIFIVGSDQIWHRNLYYDFGSVAFLDYIYNDKKKIAYASSFGRDYWSGNDIETQEAAFYLKNFDHISVREQSGVNICKNYFNVNAECVLDPVFLCDKKHYLKLSEKANYKDQLDYIGGYILDIDEFRLNILHELQEQLGMTCHLLTDAFRETMTEDETIRIDREAFCEEWLSNIINSQFVITDSFHGMCFAIIFNKPFIAICNEERGSIRFVDLLKKLGLSSRLISTNDDISIIKRLLEMKINYAKVNEILEQERIRSLKWLHHALETPKKYQMTEYDILHRKIQNAEIRANELAKRIPYIESELGNRKWDISVHRKELDEHKELLGQRLWDIQVHRKELNEHQKLLDERLWDIGVHRKELDEHKKLLDERLWDIGVHRKELDEHKELLGQRLWDIRVHRQEIDAQQEELHNLNQKQHDLENKISQLDNYWIIRICRKISFIKNKFINQYKRS